MAITTYEYGEYYALAGIKAQIGGLAICDSAGNEISSVSASSTTYTQGSLGSQGSDQLTLDSSVDFTIAAGDVGKTATKLRLKTSGGSTLLEIGLTSSQLFDTEGIYTLTSSTIGIS
jgi:hypothetical protein